MKRSFVECASNMELLRNNRHCDVTFVVGTEKERISCHTIFLVSRSPVFEVMFADRWNSASGSGDGGKVDEETDDGVKTVKPNREVNEIELPDVEPEVFQISLKYMYTGNRVNFADISQAEKILYLAQKYDVASLKNECVYFLRIKLGVPDEAIRILEISEKYQCTSLYKDAAELIAKNFGTYIKTDDFFHLSEENLSKIIGCDENACGELTIFREVHRWALNRCSELEIEVTMWNLRKVLGSCLFQLRFPTMTYPEFHRVRQKNILTANEALELYDYIGLSSKKKNQYKEPVLLFQAQPRTKPFHGLILSWPYDATFRTGSLVGPPETIQQQHVVWMKTNTNVQLHGLGFLGPIEKDAYYDVSVKIAKLTKNEVTFSTGKVTKSVFARKGQTLRFMFDDPIIIEEISQLKWSYTYIVEFALEGPVTSSSSESKRGPALAYSKGRTQFSILWKHSGSEKLAEILFKNM